MASKKIQILTSRDSGEFTTVRVASEETVAQVMGSLGFIGMIVVVDEHTLGVDDNFMGRPHDPTLFGDDNAELKPYPLSAVD